MHRYLAALSLHAFSPNIIIQARALVIARNLFSWGQEGGRDSDQGCLRASSEVQYALAIQGRSPPTLLAVPRSDFFDIVSQSNVELFFPEFNALCSPCPAEWIMEAISFSFYHGFVIAR